MCMKKLTLSLPPLTTKERSVLQFIEAELLEKGISPSYQEICDHFGFASFNSVQNYLKQLTAKGYVLIPQNQKRAIQILHSAHDFQKNLQERLNGKAEPSRNSSPNTFPGDSYNQSSPDYGQGQLKVLPIPFLGKVAAGLPLERIYDNEYIHIPAHLVKNPKDHFALRVEGDSMIEEGIFDGDTLIVQSQKSAHDGDLVVASIDQEATVKRYFFKSHPQHSNLGKQIELRPANPRLTSMWYAPDQVEIKGLVKALFREY